MKSTKRKRIRWWMILLGIIVLLILIVTGYVLYVIISYYRIDDRQSLDMEGKSKSDVFMLDKEYTVIKEQKKIIVEETQKALQQLNSSIDSYQNELLKLIDDEQVIKTLGTSSGTTTISKRFIKGKGYGSKRS